MGAGAWTRRSDELLERYGLQATWCALRGKDWRQDLRWALDEGGYERVLVAGGDGTIACVAEELAGRSSVPLLLMPGGTANLLASDLGLPADPFEALEAALRFDTRRHIDIAYANDECFLNSVVFGVFAELAETREDLRTADLGEVPKALGDAVTSLARTTADTYVLEGDLAERFTTNLLAVANNRYTHSRALLPRRERLDGAELAIYAAQADSALSFVAALARALVQGIEQSPEFSTRMARAVRIHTEPGSSYTLDGEPRTSSGTVHLRIEPRALCVQVPVDKG